jgi:ATP-dependent DNA helicase DinG
MNSPTLGSWAVIDIETTGADRNYDQVIDVGFYQFEETKLVKTYSSMVRFEGELSQFIQKLTGITSKQLRRAPLREEVELNVDELAGYRLLAHNAEFEQGFLTDWFERGSDFPSFEDSLPVLGLAFPRLSRLGLEAFIKGLGLRESEVHRGLEDSLDLLKVMLCAGRYFLDRPQDQEFLRGLILKHELSDWWAVQFLFLSCEQIDELASAIDFELKGHLDFINDFFAPKPELDESSDDEHFELEFSGENLKNIWADQEALEERFPGFVARPAQVDLSLRVGQAFKNDVHSLIQAPTGTGKTLGYLLPAALFALTEKKQVLVATGTKTLQHQAMVKDVPALKKLLGLSSERLKIKALVGSQNHLCELLYRQEEGESLSLLDQSRSFEERYSKAYFDHVFFTNSKDRDLAPLTRGDLAYVLKMKFEPLKQIERDAAVDYRSCTGQQCPFRHDCGYLRGLREAREADLIIGNHALMFSWTRSFPRPEHIIVDEAHKLEGEVTEACTMRVSSVMLETVQRQLLNGQGLGSLFYLMAQKESSKGASTPVIQELRQQSLSTAARLEDHTKGLNDKIELYFKQKPRYTPIYWNEVPMLTGQTRDALGLTLFHHFESLRYILQDFNHQLLPWRGRYEARGLEENELIALTRFETFAGHLEDIQIVFDALLGTEANPGPREDYACSMKFKDGEGYSLEASPIDVGRVLHDSLLLTAKSCVFTSATLGNANGDQGVRGIEWATGYSYLEPARRFKKGLFLPATFDYAQKTRVFLCDDTPSLHAPEFVPFVMDRLQGLISALEGKCLLLFSSRQRFEVAREILIRDFEGKLPIFIQGMGHDVVEDFKHQGSGILLGMESFGEGIDVPGQALQFVFIDKIPDIRQDLVIQKRRDFYEANLGNEFTDYYLSHRTRSLHQKLGRLLRREDDFGAVIVADSRVRSWKGRTMQTLMKLMEPYRLERLTLEQAVIESLSFLESQQLEMNPESSPYPSDYLNT